MGTLLAHLKMSEYGGPFQRRLAYQEHVSTAKHGSSEREQFLCTWGETNIPARAVLL